MYMQLQDNLGGGQCKECIQTDFQSLYCITAAYPEPEAGIAEQYVTLRTLLVDLTSGSGFTTAVL